MTLLAAAVAHNHDVRIEAIARGFATPLFEYANEVFFLTLVHQPVVIGPVAATPRVSEVSLVQEPPDWMEAPYDFEPPVLQGRTMAATARRAALPRVEWDY